VNRSRLADLVGAGLLLSVAAAVVASALIDGAGNPVPALATLTTAALAYVAGRLLAPVAQFVTVLVAGTLAVLIFFSQFVWLVVPNGLPLGYSNANSALYVQVTALVAIAALAATSDRWRTFSLLVAGGLALLAVGTGSLAGLLTGLAVLAALLATLTGSWQPRRIVLAGCLCLVLGAHLTVVLLAATYQPHDETSPAYAAVESSLSERRLALWSDALALAADHPLTGVGPREFPVTSPTAQADPDTREAHSATLQMAAETGSAGAVALLGLLLWAAIRPLLTPPRELVTGRAVVAATAATALAVHSAVDYVLSFPVVVATAALVLGVGTSRSTSPPLLAVEGPPPPPGGFLRR
jgi:O-antigen ligase